MLDKFLVYEQQPALALDCLKSTHPVSTRVDNPSQISEVFDSISYSKGKYRHKQLSGYRVYCWFPYLWEITETQPDSVTDVHGVSLVNGTYAKCWGEMSLYLFILRPHYAYG